ncbi:hypothetical protein [Paenibacillus abyssi]|uniref:Uncharacterized protein n=1 Tax=Paenibacillus abyssi TaxID=1340531 RepID=A0A917G5K8_9BACL|nr:hypothetical protein [Paenibacillus abyssi]GGG24031.1 hypothetical protein GCM10010916_45730 [Paenibacillus abyssi]
MDNFELNSRRGNAGQDRGPEEMPERDQPAKQISDVMQTLEKELVQHLLEGEASSGASDDGAKEQAVRRKLSVPYEIRIQTESDPIVEQTIRYRQMAQELDGRYDRYMEQAKADSQKPSSD